MTGYYYGIITGYGYYIGIYIGYTIAGTTMGDGYVYWTGTDSDFFKIN